MLIKRAKIKDAQTLEDLFSELYKPELNWSREKLTKEIQDGKKSYFLGIGGEWVIGAFGINFDDSSAKFGPLIIKEGYRMRGLGSILLRFAEQITITRGLHRIWCYSLERYNVSSFYEKNNWHEERFISNFFEGQNCFIFSKEL